VEICVLRERIAPPRQLRLAFDNFIPRFDKVAGRTLVIRLAVHNVCQVRPDAEVGYVPYAASLICTEVFLGLHIKRLIKMKSFDATFGIEGAIVSMSPLVTRLTPTQPRSQVSRFEGQKTFFWGQ